MKRLALALSLALTPFFHSAHGLSATAPMRVEGRNCTVDDRGTTTWYGFFRGNREVFSPLKGSDKAKSFTKWRCFEAEQECYSWTYWMQADFPDGNSEAFCRQGG